MDNNRNFNEQNTDNNENLTHENTSFSSQPQSGTALDAATDTPQVGANTQNNGYTQNTGYTPSGAYNANGVNGSYDPYANPYMQNAYGYNAGQAPRGTVYLNQSTQQKPKKAKLSIGAAVALILVCALVSGGAAMGGTLLANAFAGNISSSDTAKWNASVSSGEPSVIFKAYENENREAGSYTQVADTVKPTVVEITTESIVTDSYFWGGGYVTSGAGSGVIISADGYIVTNNHVISGASNISVTTSDGTKYEAKVIGSDADSDIAIIKIEAADLPFALLGNSDSLTVGEEVVAVGNPLGELGGTVTNGIVSALSRDIDIDGVTMNLIQTNAAVNPGNSGGGLFNMYGELVGIVNAKSTNTSSGTSVEGIGFAIPVDTVSKVVDELLNYGYVRGKAYLGITYVDVDTSSKAMYYRVSALGLYVASSEYTDELQSGDRIVGFNGAEITYSADLKAELRKCSVGDEVTISIVRNGRYKDVVVTLHEYTPDGASLDEDSSEFESNFGGK